MRLTFFKFWNISVDARVFSNTTLMNVHFVIFRAPDIIIFRLDLLIVNII